MKAAETTLTDLSQFHKDLLEGLAQWQTRSGLPVGVRAVARDGRYDVVVHASNPRALQDTLEKFDAVREADLEPIRAFVPRASAQAPGQVRNGVRSSRDPGKVAKGGSTDIKAPSDRAPSVPDVAGEVRTGPKEIIFPVPSPTKTRSRAPRKSGAGGPPVSSRPEPAAASERPAPSATGPGGGGSTPAKGGEESAADLAALKREAWQGALELLRTGVANSRNLIAVLLGVWVAHRIFHVRGVRNARERQAAAKAAEAKAAQKAGKCGVSEPAERKGEQVSIGTYRTPKRIPAENGAAFAVASPRPTVSARGI